MRNNLQADERTAMSLVRYYRELDVYLIVKIAGHRRSGSSSQRENDYA
jgi:hypothetical protein